MSLLANLSVFFVTTLPIWSFVLTFNKFKNKLLPLYISVGLLATLTVFLLINPTAILRMSSVSTFYIIFTIVYMIVLGSKIGFDYPLKIFGLALMIMFFAADFWELPVFVYGGLNLFGYSKYFNWNYQVHHLYVFGVFYLFLKRSGLRLNLYAFSFLVLDLSLSFILCTFHSTATLVVARLVNLTLIGCMIYGSSLVG